jgi:osmotically inducible protein OsmC
MERRAQAMWEGDIKSGSGTMDTESGAFKGAYAFYSRFKGDDHPKTNPEELIGAAHAGCFSMSLADVLTNAGHTESKIYTHATVTLETADPPRIASVNLETDVYPANISDDEFIDYVEAAKEKCLVSQALSSIDITIEVEQVDEWPHQ